jgi:hypothetical protein
VRRRDASDRAEGDLRQGGLSAAAGGVQKKKQTRLQVEKNYPFAFGLALFDHF